LSPRLAKPAGIFSMKELSGGPAFDDQDAQRQILGSRLAIAQPAEPAPMMM